MGQFTLKEYAALELLRTILLFSCLCQSLLSPLLLEEYVIVRYIKNVVGNSQELKVAKMRKKLEQI